MSAVENIQDLTQSTFIDLFELSRYNPKSPFDKFRFTNHLGVSFNSKPYNPLPCQIDSIEFTSDGSQPEPSITIADTGGVIGDLINLYDNIEEAEIRIIRTQKRYLDGQPDADPTAIISVADFLIARREPYVPREYVTFLLANPIDIDGVKLPGRYLLRKCSWIYRDENCGYTGDKGFKLSNEPTLNSALDKCGKTLQSCKLRFGENVALPFGGFPGMTRRS